MQEAVNHGLHCNVVGSGDNMDLNTRLSQSCAAIRSHRDLKPHVGLILGSGLGWVADKIEHATAIDYSLIPHFPVSTAAGHAGKLVVGYLSGLPIVAMKGRTHLYEGHAVDVATYPVRCMQKLGAEILIVSNASGGVNPRFQSGEVVAIDSHIDLMMRPRVMGSREPDIFLSPRQPMYDASLIRMASKAAIRCGFALPQGTYLATLGPNYETRAEYRFFRKIGADMVGMSTVPEVQVAVELNMRVLGFSVVTNVANPDSLAKTDHAEVLSWSARAQRKLEPLLASLLSDLSGPPD
jgi:purine-nucleoside phosphorylase